MRDTGTVLTVTRSSEELADTVAAALVSAVREHQVAGRVPSVVLTGGSIADAIHRSVVDAPGAQEVDWSRVEVWFGDERFVARDDEDRNALHARHCLLDHLPFDPDRVHEMGWSDGPWGDDVDAAAAAYADELSRVLGDQPGFDVLMLGIGPDGHCASLFPGHPQVRASGLCVAVRESPKPPPTRISLTMGLLRSAAEVWFVASGEDKAPAVARAYAGDDVDEVPAAGPRGTGTTKWWLDEAVAADLPR